LSDREKNGLRGRVASVRTEFFDCDQQTGEVLGGPQRATIETYHPDGHITSLINENWDGSMSTTTYIYSSRGDLAEVKSEFNGMFHGGAVSQYDAAGRLVRTTNEAQNGAKWQSASCTYDDGGSKTEVQFPLPDFVLAEMMTSAKASRQALGHPAGEVGYDASLTCTTTIYYDARGNRLEELRHNPNRELIGRVIYTYDGQGRLTEEREQIGPGSVFDQISSDPGADAAELESLQQTLEQAFETGAGLLLTTYSYDLDGKKIEEVARQGPFSSTRQMFAYDEYGNLAAVHYGEERTDFEAGPDGRLSPASPSRRDSYVHRFAYGYDSHGNWTQKTLTTIDNAGDQHHSNVERRAITYHPPEV